jgi:hypothetical protein
VYGTTEHNDLFADIKKLVETHFKPIKSANNRNLALGFAAGVAAIAGTALRLL